MASKKNKKKAQAKAQPQKAAAQQKPAAPAPAKASAKKAAQKKAKAKKGGKPGVFARVKSYLGAVKTEMHRVSWPTRQELVSYSVVVIVSLVVVGVVIAGLDTVISQALVLLSGLRG